MFKRTIAAVTTACLIGLGVIGASTAASAEDVAPTTEVTTEAAPEAPAPEAAPEQAAPAPAEPEVAPVSEPEAVVAEEPAAPESAPEPEANANDPPSAARSIAPETETLTVVKPWICHAVNGKGELGNGWNLIDPDKASSHIDESVWPNGSYWKHASNDGLRHDQYATWSVWHWTCPGSQVADSFVTVAWRMPSYVNSTTATWPQTYVNRANTASPNLGALDSYLNGLAYGCFQVDVYKESDTTEALIAGGHLDGPGNPPEDLIDGGWGTAYKIVKVGNFCNIQQDAKADVGITPATCTDGQVLSYGDGNIANALFSGTASGTEGPASYSVLASAIFGHAFDGGALTQAFNGTLSGPLDPNEFTECQGDQPKTTYRHAKVCSAPGTATTTYYKTVYAWDTESRAWVGTESIVKTESFPAIWCAVKVTPEPPVWNDECGFDNAGWTLPGEAEGYHYVLSDWHGYKVATLVLDYGYYVDIWHTQFIFKDKDSNVECPVATVAWDGTNVCSDRDGSGFLTVDHATLKRAYWNGQDYTEIGSLSDFHPGQYDATSEGDFVLVYKADDGYRFPGDKRYFHLEFNVTHATFGDCAVGIPTQFAAEPTPPTCTEDGALPNIEEEIVAEAVTIGHVTLSFDRDYDGPGEYTLTATTEDGYTFEDGTTVKTRVITVDGATGIFQNTDPFGDCYQEVVVVPTNPTVTDACGPDNLVITLPADTAEITYSKDGNVVTATAADGFVFSDGESTYSTWVWDGITDSNTPCPVTPASNPLPPVVTTPHGALAHTGADDTAMIGGIAALLLVAGAGAVALARRRQQV